MKNKLNKQNIDRELISQLLFNNYKDDDNLGNEIITLIGFSILLFTIFSKEWLHLIIGLIFITRIKIKL